MQVVYSHLYKFMGVSAGNAHWLIMQFHGVPIFFVLSGFLISMSWERKPDIKLFAINRALRILPGLWTCIVITIVVVTFFRFDVFHTAGILWVIAQFVGLIYTPGFLDEFGFGSYNGALWTIPVEIQFYCLLPIVYILFRRFNPTTIFVYLFVLFFFISVIYRTHAPSLAGVNPEPEMIHFKLIRYSFLPHIFLFFLGVLIQRTGVYKSKLILGKGLFWLILYIALTIVTPNIVLLKQLLLCVLGLVTISLGFTLNELSNYVLRRNDVSYGIYIYHGLVINIFFQLQLTGSWHYASLVVLFTFLLGYLSWIFIERVCIKFKPSSQYTIDRNLSS